jgi:hypothetical protein
LESSCCFMIDSYETTQLDSYEVTAWPKWNNRSIPMKQQLDSYKTTARFL